MAKSKTKRRKKSSNKNIDIEREIQERTRIVEGKKKINWVIKMYEQKEKM